MVEDLLIFLALAKRGGSGWRYSATGGAMPVISTPNIGFFDRNATPIALQQER
jgi:hypothetical protein